MFSGSIITDAQWFLDALAARAPRAAVAVPEPEDQP